MNKDQNLKIDSHDISSLWDIHSLPSDLEDTLPYIRKMHEYPYKTYKTRINQLGFEGDRALDAGCGTGTWAFPLSKSFREIYAIDINKPRVNTAKWLCSKFNIENIEFAYDSVLDINQPDNSFDLVFCYGVVISYLDISEVLKEFQRVLRPGGKIYCCVNGLGWSYYLKDVRGKANKKFIEMGKQGIYNTLTAPFLNQALEFKSYRSTWLSSFLFNSLNHASIKSIRGSMTKQEYVAIEEFSHFLKQKQNSRFLEFMGIIDTLANDCGLNFLQTLSSDLTDFKEGRTTNFSFHKSGRGYSPTVMENKLADNDFKDFYWAEEGALFPNGDKGDADFSPFFGGKHDGKLKVWEFVATKKST